jgi:methylthioribose-1-phosphate isomerase
MIHSNVHAFKWNADTQYLEVIDQLALPDIERFVSLKTVADVADAITGMLVRGAPAIGIVAAYGIYYSARKFWDEPNKLELIQRDKNTLAETRPTAVNLFWALERMMHCVNAHIADQTPDAILAEAKNIWDEDLAMNLALSEHGADEIGNVRNILTHCNAGALATGGLGTALGVIRAIDARKKAKGESLHVWVDETRPYLQGARLTSWELMKDDIDCTLITDNMSAHLMKQGLVDAIVLGADRIAANYDVANKIGTYALAILANYHHIPFYSAAPTSTFDPSIQTGSDIVIEERSDREVVFVKGNRIAPENVKVRHPAFDVTPHELITGIITPNGVIRPNN